MKLDKILVPLDGSALGRLVLGSAFREEAHCV
jgi:hypothetical protein